ncbi:MAG: aminotransferase class V-fold PLP-dependent enzyme [Cytophagaceae bacterium]|nr:aminotransferase class V-fold PLP-dependent enzyme [Cytophagaceae bacterium]
MEHYIHDAFQSGILSQNHRSPAFMQLYENTWTTVRSYFEVPDDYSLYFVSSATECWEILSQELGQLKNLHLYNGAFGEKGFNINASFHPNTVIGLPFDQEENPAAQTYSAEVIHLTQNETANGTQLSAVWLKVLRKNNTTAFITVDATSSLGGQALPMASADVWFASVQKCLGLPSGMAVLICSKRLVDFCKKNNSGYYNSITSLEDQFQKRQTTHTPNILGIYLLYRVLSERLKLNELHHTLKQQARQWYELIEQHALFESLIYNKDVRSDTIITVKGNPSDIERFKNHCAEKEYIIGNGYGADKNSTFRIANFPAHQAAEVAFLQHLLINFK